MRFLKDEAIGVESSVVKLTFTSTILIEGSEFRNDRSPSFSVKGKISLPEGKDQNDLK